MIDRACGSRAMYDRNPIALMNRAFTARPVSSSITIDARPSSRERASRNTRYVETMPPMHAAIGRLQMLVPKLNSSAEHKKQCRAEGRSARCADQPGLDDRVAKQRLHQRAADAEARADEQAKNSTRQSQLEKDPLIQCRLRLAGKQAKQAPRRYVADRKIDRAIADRRRQHDEHGRRPGCEQQ